MEGGEGGKGTSEVCVRLFFSCVVPFSYAHLRNIFHFCFSKSHRKDAERMSKEFRQAQILVLFGHSPTTPNLISFLNPRTKCLSTFYAIPQ